MRLFKVYFLFIIIITVSCNEKSNVTLKKTDIDALLTKQNFKASNSLEIPYRILKPKDSKTKNPLLIFYMVVEIEGQKMKPIFIVNLDGLLTPIHY